MAGTLGQAGASTRIKNKTAFTEPFSPHEGGDQVSIWEGKEPGSCLANDPTDRLLPPRRVAELLLTDANELRTATELRTIRECDVLCEELGLGMFAQQKAAKI